MTRSAALSRSVHVSPLTANTTATPPQQRRRRRGPARRRATTSGALATRDLTPTPYEEALFDAAPIAFDALLLDQRLLQGIRDLGWRDTRPVQSGVIPLALGGDDVIACAETGTGKTAAFLVPILQRFLQAPADRIPATRALVLAPTRELVVQIEDQVQGLTYHTTVSSAPVYGGVPMDAQERAL